MSISKEDLKLFISEAEDLIQKVEDEIFELEEVAHEVQISVLKNMTSRTSKVLRIIWEFVRVTK